MQKRIGKKILSMILAICMVIGMLPAQLMQFASAADPEHTYSYNLYKAMYQGDRGYRADLMNSYNLTTVGHPEELNVGTDSDPWKIVGKSVNSKFAIMSSAYAYILTGPVGEWASIQIKVPESGTYKPSIIGGMWNQSPAMKVYIAPADATNPRDVKYLASELDTYAATAQWKYQYDLPEQDFAAGDYIVTFEINGTNTAAPTLFGKFAISAINLDRTGDTSLKLSAAEKQVVALNASLDLAVTATLDGSNLPLAEATSISAVSTDESIATVVAQGGKFTVTGKAYGETDIFVTVTSGAKSASIAVPIYVGKSAGYTYDYNKVSTGDEKGLDPKTVTSLSMTTAGSADEINKGSRWITDPWCYDSSDNDAWYMLFGWIGYGIMMGMENKGGPQGADGNGKWDRFKIQVNESGTYTPELEHGSWTNGSEMELYLAPENAQDPMAEEYLLGGFSAYQASGTKWDNKAKFETKELTAGNYLLTYKYIKESPSASLHRVPVRAFRLLRDEINYFSLGATERISNRIGDTVKKPLYAQYNFENIDISEVSSLSVKSSKSSVADASIQNIDGKQTLVVESKGEGSATLTLSGSYKGISISKTISVEVSRPSYNYNYMKLRKTWNSAYDIKTITSFEQLRAYSATELNAGYGAEETDPYAYNSASANIQIAFDEAYGLRLDNAAANDYFATNIEVLGTESYRPVLTYGAWASGPIVDLYLAPASAANPRDAQYKIGTVDTYQASAEWMKKATFPSVSLNAGSYVLSYVITGKNSAAAAQRFAVSSFALTPAPKNNLVINTTVPAVYQNNEGVIAISAALDDVAVPIANFSKFDVVSEDPETLEVISAGAEGIKVLGKKLGKTTLTIHATYNDINTIKKVEVEVRALEYVYDYRYVGFKEYGKGVDIKTVTDFGMTTIGGPEEVNPTHPQCDWTDPWAWIAEGQGSNFSFTDGLYGCMWDGGVGAWASFKIQVKTGGVYSATSENGIWANGGIFNLYLAPEGAENPRDQKYLLGQIDTYGLTSSENWVRQYPLRNVTLDAGVYVITYEKVGKNPASGGNRCPIGAFKLNTPTKKETYLSANLEDSRVMLGAVKEVPLKLDVDGREIDFTGVEDIAVASSDQEVATATVTRSADKKTAALAITGKSFGTANLTIKAVVDGETITCTANISVVDPEELDYVQLFAEKDTLHSGENLATELRAFRMNGEAIDLSQMVPYYQSADPSIVSVDGNGVLTGRNRGITSITAFVEIDGIMRKAMLDISVDTDALITTAKMQVPGSIQIGESIDLAITGRLSSGSAYTSSNATFEIVSVEPEGCATISGAKLTGKELGSVTVRAIVAESGEQERIETEPVTITIREKQAEVGGNISYNFRNDQTTKILDATVAQNGWALNHDMTDPKVFGDNAKHLRYQVYGIACLASEKNTQLGSDITFDVNIPEDGAYVLLVDGGQYTGGFLASIYIDKEYVGQYDFYSTKNLKVGPSVTMNAVELSAGTHQVTFRRTSDQGYLYLGSMNFKKLEKMPEIQGFALNAGKNELAVGESTTLNAGIITSDGSSYTFGRLFENNAEDLNNYMSVTISNPEIISMDGSSITGLKEGTTSIVLKGAYQGTVTEKSIDITVDSLLQAKLIATAENTSLKPSDTHGEQIKVMAVDALENEIDLTGATITYQNTDENVIMVTDTGLVFPVSVGQANVIVRVVKGDLNLTATITFDIRTGKTEASYYTPERVQAIRDNIKVYDWAKGSSEALIKKADRYLDKQDLLWNTITTQELPRGITVGYRHDPGAYNCRYCGKDLRAQYGYYGWLLDPFADAFKVQCPECRRKFPSNDFESFYKLGIQEDGNWSYELAKTKNAELVANGEDGYLKNILYPEMDEKMGVTNWGVDDGYGYRTGKTIVGGNGANQEETHTYIAYYNHWGVWYNYGNNLNGGIIQQASEVLREAYLYTGDARYGRIGAALVDRVSDVYPDMYLKPYFPQFFNSDSTTPKGKMVGCIWQHGLSRTFVQGYDAFYPMYDDAQTLMYIQKKAATLNLSEEKASPALIRNRIEDNLLRQTYTDIRSGNVHGNFGMHQSLAAMTGVVLDTMPETKEMIDWIFRNSTDSYASADIRGGNVLAQLVNLIDRDGHGAESAPGYNWLWLGTTTNIANYLAGYKTYEAADLYKNPKFLKMYKALMPLTLTRRATAQIGDSGATGKDGFTPGISDMINGFMYSEDIELAQFIYMMNGNSVEGLHANYMTPNPESVQEKIQEVIDTYGEYDIDRSQQLAGYGFSILRDGSYYPSADSAKTLDTQRDFWLYYGGANSHKHMDVLNLGIEAYGFNMAPDLGYPEAADGAEKNIVWGQGTINHNTVMVNEQPHNRLPSNNVTGTTERTNGNPLHFDDSGRVKVMDIDAPTLATNGTYADPSGIFRRSIVMVRVNDEISYGVDFFRVKGGKTHTYNFHAMSDEIYETEGLTFAQQTMGTYAGPDVAFGTLGYSNGFSWLYNVRRAVYPQTGEFSIDFKIKDFRQLLKRPMDLHLRMTMLNDFDVSEVAIATGQPPQVSDNPKEFEFVMVKRSDPSAQNLDTLFTTVLEPYNEERYIKSMSQVPVYRTGGDKPGALDVVKAIKVELTNGNIDYIVYATNNAVQYRVDDTFEFKGFVGVYTVKDGKCVYAYGNDATLVGEMTGTAAYTGKVVDFTKELTNKNSITVTFDQPVDINLLTNKFINITNNRKENGAYEILNATTTNNRTYTLDVGDCSLIDKFKDQNDNDAGYLYNIAEGQTFKIALPLITDTAPVFTAISDKSVEAGSELKFNVVAESNSNAKLTYSAGEMPRGANFDPETQSFTWIPDSSQLGDAHATFHVTDGIFTDSLHVRMKVYNSASGGGDKPIDNPSGGTGGGGGTGGNGNNNQGEVDPPVVTVEEDEVKFAASTEETTADTKLGSVTFPNGTFAEDGQGTLKIKKENEKFNISVSATVDMEEKPAKVSLNYTPADNMTDKNCIVVKDANGNIIPNGKYADGKMTFYTDTFGDFTIVYNPKSFTDLGNHAWASEAITRLAARGIINGITATTYGPARNITRADFTTLIVRAFGFEGEAASFADVPANAYYAEPVGIAKTLGIVGGVNESDFVPTAEITRQDMMVIVARALDKAGYALASSADVAFSDLDQVSDYAKDAAVNLAASGIIAGSNGKINPKGKTTRAEVAVILDRIVFMN